MNLRIAWFTPDPAVYPKERYPISAYFTDCLLPLLAQQHDVEVFTNSFDFQKFTNFNCPTAHYLRAFEVHQQKPFDVFFYQLENNKHSNFARMHCALEPGIVLFHDFVFSNYGPEPILNSPWQDVCRLQADANYSWPDYQKEHQAMGPQAYREAAFATTAIFNNPNFVGDFKRSAAPRIFDSSAYFLPVPVVPTTAGAKAQAAGDAFQIAYCGTPGVEFRAHYLLGALRENQHCQLLWLIDEQEKFQAEKLIQENELSNVQLVLGRTPERWAELQSSAQLAVHTLFSFYCSFSPYLEISLAAGVPVVVSDFASADYLPSSMIFKIAVGLGEQQELSAVIKKLSAGNLQQSISQQIKVFANEEYSQQKVAAELSYIFTQEAQKDSAQKAKANWKNLQMRAGEQLLANAKKALIGEDVILGQLNEFCAGHLGADDELLELISRIGK